MLSGPDTILSGKGVGAIYPKSERLELLLGAMEFGNIKIISETEMDVFTAGVCLPAAIQKAGGEIEKKAAIKRISVEYPLFAALHAWAVEALPALETEADRDNYISMMITQGGVTDAIVRHLESGAPLDAALRKGINRTKKSLMKPSSPLPNR